MGRPKPKLHLDFDMEWVGEHYKCKRRLKCCKDGEYMSGVWGRYFLYYKHYPWLNGYYECEMAEGIGCQHLMASYASQYRLNDHEVHSFVENAVFLKHERGIVKL